MHIKAHRVEYQQISAMRDVYRQEMNCQIIHDSLHTRPGWVLEYLLSADGATIGYGSIAISGPWKDRPTVCEFFVLPHHRSKLFDSFSALLAASGAKMIETQSNAPLLTVMLHTFAQNVESESILFHDKVTTSHSIPGALFRRAVAGDADQIRREQLDPDAKWVVETGSSVVAAGDILFHYNRPYGDIYMKVAESFRQRGLGAYLVQELKRTCYEMGSVPAARCNPANVASRKTLLKAGFVPCGHILHGSLPT